MLGTMSAQKFFIPAPSRRVTEMAGGEALATILVFARKLSPLSWPSRSQAFEAEWSVVQEHFAKHAASFPPGISVASIWRSLITGTIEKLAPRYVREIDLAAWLFLSVHENWRAVGHAFLTAHADDYFLWRKLHPLHETIAGAIDDFTAAAHRDRGNDAAATRH